jgi:SAM-dependent methyltransferase
MKALRERINRFGYRNRLEKRHYDEKYFTRTKLEGPPVSVPYMRFLLSPVLKNASFLLDAGCGTGECISLAKEYGKDAVGIDVSPFAARKSRQILGNILNMPFRDEIFDGVMAFEVIEHLALNDAICFLRECHRVLESRGLLVLSTPNWLPRFSLWLHGNTDLTHKVYYNPVSIMRTLRQCGFDKVQLTSFMELRLRSKVSFGEMSVSTLFGLGMIVVCRKSKSC